MFLEDIAHTCLCTINETGDDEYFCFDHVLQDGTVQSFNPILGFKQSATYSRYLRSALMLSKARNIPKGLFGPFREKKEESILQKI